MKNREPWNFCETPKEKCTMNYCDENGCQNRKRNYVEGNSLIADVSKRYYLTKDREGNYQLLNELAYEKKLIYG